MSSRTSRRELTLAIGLTLLISSPAFTQDTSALQPSPVQPPILPETEVEATPPVGPSPFEPQPMGGDFSGGFADSVLSGTLFDSPPVSGYRAGSSTTGSLINIADADLPATVNVIPRDVLDDQIALEFQDVIRNAGGVSPAGDGLFQDRIFIRGMEVGSRNFRKDGFLDPTFVPRDFQNVERVEILKGPASVLYGAGDPAGTVNIITKRPMRARFADAGYTFGSWNQNRFTLDANGYGSRSGNVLYRINVAHEEANSFVDFDYLDRTQISPSVTWLLSENTSLNWSGEYHRHNSLGFQGTPAVNGDPLFLPPSAYVGEPGNDFFRAEEFRQSLVLTHQLSDTWAFTLGGNSLFYNFPNSTTAATSPIAPLPPGPFFFRSRSDVPLEDEQSQSVIANLAGEFHTGALHHTFVAGVEYNYFDSASRFESGILATPIDATNPAYLNPAAIPVFTSDFPVFRQQRVGGYLQDMVEFNPYWKALGGVRFDTVDFKFQRDIGGGPVVTEETFNRVSPRGGLVFQPLGNDLLSLYYSYSQSFSPPGGGIYLSSGLQPILGESHEAGIKTELLDGLSLTAAGFYTTRQNDAFNVQSIVLTQVGEVRSQGAELNLIGTLTEDWSVIANYTYTDARLFDDVQPQFDNQRARNVPYHIGNLWTRYNFYRDDCQTIGAALGLVYFGERPADLENNLMLPGFGRWDAGLYYRNGRVGAGVYLENLFDVQYAASSINEYQIFQGAPFNVRANLTYSF